MTRAPGEGKSLSAAVVQLCSGSSRERNLERAANLMGAAVAAGAELLVLPENFSFMGATEAEKRAHREDPEAGPSRLFLQDFARQHHVWIVGGSIPLGGQEGGKVTNTSLLVDNTGKVRARYDKIHLFDAQLGERETIKESDIIQPGSEPVVGPTPFGPLGLSICYDLRFPELYRRLVSAGATLLAVPAAFTLTTGRDHWELLLRARAVENFAYVLAADQWGRHPGGRSTYGHSMIVEPWGTVIARCPDGEGFALAVLDPQRVADSRGRIPCLHHRVL
ncbi:MAG: carbon-nitrogen hydrolase family protein [Magnetococcales bacterium]|nr:carbon-nitrogen hydrolase family protein [Magnetococcales bacterium]